MSDNLNNQFHDGVLVALDGMPTSEDFVIDYLADAAAEFNEFGAALLRDGDFDEAGKALIRAMWLADAAEAMIQQQKARQEEFERNYPGTTFTYVGGAKG